MKIKRFTENSRGTAAVEMAAILPILVVITLGAVDLGRVFYDAVGVANAARAGLSYGSLDDARSKDMSMITSTATADAVSMYGGVTLNVTRFCECSDESVVDCEDGTCSEGTRRVYVKVEASKTFSTTLPYPRIPSSTTITRESYMRAQ